MYRLFFIFFCEDQVYEWGRFQKTGSHTRTKITPSYPPPPRARAASTIPRDYYSQYWVLATTNQPALVNDHGWLIIAWK